MKQSAFATAALISLSLLATTATNAQRLKKVTADNPRYAPVPFISVDHAPPPASGEDIYLNNISTRAVRDFERRFKEADKPRWYACKRGWLVKFNHHDIKTSVAYDSRGTWVYSIKCYGEKEMPRDVRALVKTVYYDYKITLVQEITEPGIDGPVYAVQAEDKDHILMIRVYNNDVQLASRLRKTM